MIKDTGLDEISGSVKYPQVGSGVWMSLYSSRLNIEMTTKTTNYASGQLDTSNNLTFNNNELYLKGGLGLIDVMPNNLVDGTDTVIGVIIRNVVPREVVDNSITYIALTIQAEQVK